MSNVNTLLKLFILNLYVKVCTDINSLFYFIINFFFPSYLFFCLLDAVCCCYPTWTKQKNTKKEW